MYDNLTPDTVADLVATLRYLRRQYEINGRLDGLNMRHVEKSLARVEIEVMVQRAFAHAARIAIPATE
jgi:hypothetical protein